MRWCLGLVVVAGCSFRHGTGPSAGDDAQPIDASADAMKQVDATSNAWAYRRTITIDNSGLGALSSFPLVLFLDDTRINYSHTAPNGSDLRFSDANGGIEYEIERWNP